MTRPGARPAAHDAQASRLPPLPRLGRCGAVYFRLGVFARPLVHAGCVERYGSDPLLVLCVQSWTWRCAVLAAVAALQHVLRAVPDWYLERVLAGRPDYFGGVCGPQGYWMAVGRGVGYLCAW